MTTFPFSAVVAQEEAQLALLLAAVDPGIGGVLLRGDKGSAKSTLARGLAGLLPGDAPFVELPVGATEDAVLGSLDLGEALAGGGVQVRPGLLARAHGGVLYVDEVNLLPDHLVDVVLDTVASGALHLERDGVSAAMPARFVLVGSMNPEEGELRPQLLDRFGLVVEVRAPADPEDRAAAVRARLAFDAEGGDPHGADAELAGRLLEARPAALPPSVIEVACRLALAVGAEGLRADLVLCRAAAALAGWEGRAEAGPDDVERVAPLVLAHRRRRRPFDPPSIERDELQRALDEARGAEPQPEPEAGPGPEGAASPPTGRWGDLAGPADAPGAVALPPPAGRGPSGPDVRGPLVGSREPTGGEPRGVAIAASLRAGLRRRSGSPDGTVLEAEDLREPVRRAPPRRCVVLAVDSSGSMGTRERVEAATGAVLGLLADAYRRRHEVALVAFHGDGAQVVLPPTASVELARARLDAVPTGGSTPLAEGIEHAVRVACSLPDGTEPFVVLITDGRATGAADALDRALAAAGEAGTSGVRGVVLDAERGTTRLGLAGRLAGAWGVACVAVDEVSAGAIEHAVRAAVR